MVVENEKEQGGTLRDYARVVWRRKWIVLAVAVAVTALAVAYTHAKTPMYKASAQLIYESQLDVSDPSSSCVLHRPDTVVCAAQQRGQRDRQPRPGRECEDPAPLGRAGGQLHGVGCTGCNVEPD